MQIKTVNIKQKLFHFLKKIYVQLHIKLISMWPTDGYNYKYKYNVAHITDTVQYQVR